MARIARMTAVFGGDDSGLQAAARRSEATINSYIRGVDGRLRDAKGRFVSTGKAAQEMGDQVKRGADKGSGGLDLLSAATGTLKRAFAALAIGEIVRQIVRFGAETSKVASDVNEALQKNQVLFGEHAKTVDAWSNQTATALGLSRKAALEATGDYGNLFRGMGFGQEQAAKWSVSLVKLASDLASFNNKPLEEAIGALRSGLVGEIEPLRRFGVNMNETVLKAEALRMGLGEVTGTLSPQQKALAAISILYKQTSAAQGDFARTAAGAANQERILAAQTENLKEKIGKLTLPIRLAITTELNKLVGVLARIDFTKVIADFKAFGQSVGQSEVAKFFIAQWEKVVAFFHNNMPLIRAAVENVLRNLNDLWNRYGGYIYQIVVTIWGAIKKFIEFVTDRVLLNIKAFLQVLSGDWRGALQTIAQMNERILRFIADLLMAGVKLIGWFARATISAVADLYTNLSRWLGDLFGNLGSQIGMRLGIALTDAFGAAAEPVARRIWQFSQSIGKMMGQTTATAMMPFGAGAKALDSMLPEVAAPTLPKLSLPSFPTLAPAPKMPNLGGMPNLAGVRPTDTTPGKSKEEKKALSDLQNFLARLNELRVKLGLIRRGVSQELAELIASNPNVPQKTVRLFYSLTQDLKAFTESADKAKQRLKEIADYQRSMRESVNSERFNALFERQAKAVGARPGDDIAIQLRDIKNDKVIRRFDTPFIPGGGEVQKLLTSLADGNGALTPNALKDFNAKFPAANASDVAKATRLNAEWMADYARRYADRLKELREETDKLSASETKRTASSQLFFQLLGGEWKYSSEQEIATLKAAALAYDQKTEAQERQKAAAEAGAAADRMIAELQGRLSELRTGRADTEENFAQLLELFKGLGLNAIFAAGAVLKLRQEYKQLSEEQKRAEAKQRRAQGDATAIGSTIGRAARGIWEDLISGNAGLIKRFARRIGDSITDAIGTAIERTVTRSIAEKLSKALLDGVGPALKKLTDAVKESAGAAGASAEALLSGAFSILSVLNRKKKSGLGSILGGIAGAFIPGGGLLSALAGYNIGNALDNGDIGGAILGGVNFKAASGIGQNGSWSGLGSGGRSVVINQTLINNAPINGLAGVDQISQSMGRSAERKLAFVGG